MAKSAKKPETATGGLPDMTVAMMAGSPALAKAWADIMRESARFLSDRLQEDMETQKALLSCKNPAEVVQVQSEFFRKAMVDYTDEAQRMLMLMTGAGEDALEETKSTTKRGYDDVPV